jgi:DNA end-binding protein Ku
MPVAGRSPPECWPMKMRPIWAGHLKLSLVQIQIRVYTALNTAETIQFNLLHRDCHQRVRQKLSCPVHGEIKREETVRGYEFEKDKYVVIDEADLQKVRLETTRVIEITQFVRLRELDSIYLDAPYFIAPEGRVASEGYFVLQQAIQRAGVVGIGRVVLNSREKLLVLKPAGKGLMFTTLRSETEVRASESVFHDLLPSKLDPEQLQLAQQLIAQKTGLLAQGTFTDRYQAALVELIQTKVKGAQPVIASPNPRENVVNLMDALRQSIAVAVKRPKTRSVQAKVAA